jgi:putative redox protein
LRPAFDVIMILRKGRQQVTDCVADIEAERAATDPKSSPKSTSTSPSQARRSTPSGSNRRYTCRPRNTARPASCSGKTAEITHDFEVVEG